MQVETASLDSRWRTKPLFRIKFHGPVQHSEEAQIEWVKPDIEPHTGPIRRRRAHPVPPRLQLTIRKKRWNAEQSPTLENVGSYLMFVRNPNSNTYTAVPIVCCDAGPVN